MMPSVLPVKNEQAMDLAGIVSRMKQGIPPVDAQEYLWRVRLEAEGIPDVIVSDVNPRDFDQQQTPNMPCIPDFSEVKDKEFLLPSDEWKDMILADFAELRQLIAYWQEVGMSIHKRIEVPRMSDESGWIKFFFGKVNDDEETDNDSQV
jgi:survival of motor neuron protein-interacting protein 1